MGVKLLAQLKINGQEVYDPLSISGEKVNTVGDLVNLLLPVVFTLALIAVFIYLLWAGVDMARGMGNPDAVKKGKARITNAIVGFILLSLSYWGAQLAQNIFWGK
jgi:hypothetical protein